MPRGFAAQKAHLNQTESRPRVDREASVASGQFLGNMISTQVWQNLQRDAGAVLVDIRTRAEWTFVGGPDLSSLAKTVVQVEWQTFPGMERNPRFVRELQAQGVTPGRPVYLICRSGIRSRRWPRSGSTSGTWSAPTGRRRTTRSPSWSRPGCRPD